MGFNFYEQKCNLAEQLKKVENGKPPPFSSQSFGMKQFALENTINQNDTRLRIFSGTANPALAQVIYHIFFYVLCLILLNIGYFMNGFLV